MIPEIHAELSARRYGGVPEDYIDIHQLMDSSKIAFPGNAHRALTHNIWFVTTILPKVFGAMRTNSDGKRYSVKDVGEFHILEDYKFRFVPSAQDFLENLQVQPWMNNGNGLPSSCKNVFRTRKEAESFVVREEEQV